MGRIDGCDGADEVIIAIGKRIHAFCSGSTLSPRKNHDGVRNLLAILGRSRKRV
jgi:hypothetical protein